MIAIEKIAFGGGCHWCTEAVFQSLLGVHKVEQGFIASIDENDSLSEAVIVYFNPKEIELKTLIEIHLYTHKSTSNHSMRTKYRSAIYIFSEEQRRSSIEILASFQEVFENKIITQVLLFKTFNPSPEAFQDYYQKNPNKPFCEKYIYPKLNLVTQQFSKRVDPTKSGDIVV
jgi:peptide-methionine (S)-S-oxide reductase